MRLGRILRYRFRSLIRSSRAEAEMQREIELHLEQLTREHMEAGLTRDEASRAARRAFGSVESTKELCRDMRRVHVVEDLFKDALYAWRLLRKSPAFTLTAALSLALGIGANTAIFSLLDLVLLKALPVERPQRLFFVDNSGGKSGGSNAPPYPCYTTLRDRNRYFSSMAAFDGGPFKVTIDGSAEQVAGQYASGSYFDVLGVRPLLGRVLTPADDAQPGRGGADGPVAVISHAFWTRRFDASPSVLGKTIQVGTNWVTIVGVTPPEFFGLQVGMPIDVTLPFMLSGSSFDPQAWWFSVVGRLKDGASVEQARADLDAMFQNYMREQGLTGEMRKYFDRIELVPADKGLNELRRRFSQPLAVMMAIVGVVLLIGCANVANLLLARASARQGEMAIKLALGASRGRLVRQLLTEGAMLAGFGAVAGVVVAYWGVRLLAGFFGDESRQIVLEPRFDSRVLLFTTTVTALTGLLFSLVPAFHTTRPDAARPAYGARTSSGGSGGSGVWGGSGLAGLSVLSVLSRFRFGHALLVLQVTLSLVLLCSAALFVRTLRNLDALDPGFAHDDVLTMRVDATVPRLKADWRSVEGRAESARLGVMWAELNERVRRLPGVRAAALSTLSPMSGRDRGISIAVAGAPPRPESDRSIHLNQIAPAYFDTLGIQLARGRAFTDRDGPKAPKVAILNDTAARFYFGNDDPVGRRVIFFPGPRATEEFEVVGVARDTRYESLRLPDERMVYVPIPQALDRLTGVTVAVRAHADATALLPAIRAEVRGAVPGGFVTKVKTVAQQVDASLLRERMLSSLATAFGLLALILASIGLHGVLSYGVTRRTREIGIRVAIGAGRPAVIWLVLRETIVLVGLGLILGIAAVLALGRYIDSLLFGIGPGDPLAIGAAVIVLTGVAAAAGYVPARRASQVDPVVALRCE